MTDQPHEKSYYGIGYDYLAELIANKTPNSKINVHISSRASEFKDDFARREFMSGVRDSFTKIYIDKATKLILEWAKNKSFTTLSIFFNELNRLIVRTIGTNEL